MDLWQCLRRRQYDDVEVEVPKVKPENLQLIRQWQQSVEDQWYLQLQGCPKLGGGHAQRYL